jgi:hypothetical protein
MFFELPIGPVLVIATLLIFLLFCTALVVIMALRAQPDPNDAWTEEQQKQAMELVEKLKKWQDEGKPI